MIVTAYCPSHISGYFRRIAGQDRSTTGSLGAGIVIDPGITVKVTAANKTSVSIRQTMSGGRIRQVSDRSPPLESALCRIGVDARVVTESPLPVGAGFGLSASALIATLTAVNHLAGLDMDPKKIASIAHETEVEHRTGLGDVAACQGGGRVVRTGPGIEGEIHRYYDISGPVCAVSFGPIHTPSVIGSAAQMALVEQAFPADVPVTVEEFLRASRAFAYNSGLSTPEVRRILEACAAEGVPAGMTMLGNGVFALGRKAYSVLRPFGHVYRCEMAKEGARITGVNP